MRLSHYTELAELIARIDNSKDAKNFLANMLTPQELDEVTQRLQIFKLLLAGEPQRSIAEKLGVSISTVTRGSREIKYGKLGIVKLLKND
jgi:TrpR family trp operon transcriptional repressor